MNDSDADSDFRPEKQSPKEIRELLEGRRQTATPCDVVYDHRGRLCQVTSFVVAIHSDYIVLGRIAQSCWLDGWRALRLQHVICIEDTEDAAFILRAMRATDVSLPIESPIASETFIEFLGEVCESFDIITTDDDPELMNDGAAGTILDADQESITLRAMSTEGFWESDSYRIELRHITHVVFGGRYERVLEQIAKLPDT